MAVDFRDEGPGAMAGPAFRCVTLDSCVSSAWAWEGRESPVAGVLRLDELRDEELTVALRQHL